MEFIKTKITDLIICVPHIFSDERGYFFESFNQEAFEKHLGKSIRFCQDNEAKSTKGVLRGLHYQLPPYAQSKLVRVISGKVLDIAVDIRRGSATFGQYVAVELSGENKHQLFVPAGFAHGYVVLSDEAIFSYKVDNYYSKTHERGIFYKDSELKIDWKLPLNELLISEKDKIQPAFNKSELFETNF